MELSLQQKLDYLNETQQYQQIIDLLEECPMHDYDSIGHLARAYNNRGEEGDFDKAIELLNIVEDFGREDALWHFRMGYAHFYSGRYLDAGIAFEKAAALNPEDEDAFAFLKMCEEKLRSAGVSMAENYAPEFYSEEELELVEGCIAYSFGEIESVFHEIVSPDIHVDIGLIPPDEEQDFYILVTIGMGAHKMNIPEEVREYNLERSELLICLPSDWNLESEEEKWYWPVRLLKILARLPLKEDTWLGWGHTIDNGENFDESTELCGSILLSPANFGAQNFICPLPDGTEVNFYQIIPLYREEMDFKMEHGADALLEQLDSDILVLDPKRIRFSGKKNLS